MVAKQHRRHAVGARAARDRLRHLGWVTYVNDRGLVNLMKGSHLDREASAGMPSHRRSGRQGLRPGAPVERRKAVPRTVHDLGRPGLRMIVE